MLHTSVVQCYFYLVNPWCNIEFGQILLDFNMATKQNPVLEVLMSILFSLNRWLRQVAI